MIKKVFDCLFCLLFILMLKCSIVQASTRGRIGGCDRYNTAVDVSKQVPQSDYAIIATGSDFPDALCAAPLAKKYNAPIFLSYSTELGPETISELTKRNVKSVFIIGSEGAISKCVEQQLSSINIKYERIGGKDRFETSAMIADRLKSNTIVVSVNDNFPDALSISPVAAKNGWPILLTYTTAIDKSTQDYLNRTVGITTTYVLGSKGLITDDIAKQFPGYADNNRIGGSDRYETNEKVMEKFDSMYDFGKVYIATGGNYPDALVSSSLACVGKINPIVIANEGYFSDSTVTYLKSKMSSINSTIAIGSVGVVPDTAFNRIYGVNVVLDAGHGGIDPGATYGGVLEKDINLTLTKDLGAILEKSGIKVIYTRQTDETKSLDERSELANKLKTDLFVSIHHDADSKSASSSGVSTHYSTYRPNIDNTDIQVDPNNPEISRDATPPDAAIKSEKLAQIIEDELSTLGFIKRGVYDHSLAVTKMTTMPSILIEAGFMSTPSELQIIKDPNVMNQMAQKIADGINNYLNQYGIN